MTRQAGLETSFDAALAPVLADVRAVVGWLWDRGWAEAGAGNLSVDVTERLADGAEPPIDGPLAPAEIPASLAGRWLLVSAAGARFRDMASDPGRGLLLLHVDHPVGGYRVAWCRSDGIRPTSELPAHLAIHARHASDGAPHRAVLHTHPTHLIALNHLPVGADEASLNRALWAVLPEVKLLVPQGVALAPYRRTGSPELADVTVSALAGHRVVVWDKHGCLAVERDLESAFDLIDVLDKAARIQLLCRAAGAAPRGITDDELADL